MIEPSLLQRVVDLANANGLNDALITELRQEFTGVHFTLCMEDDMDSARPVREEKEFNLYLVDSSNHCSKLTNDPERASGVVLAEIMEDD